MSVLTTSALKAAPSGAVGVTVVNGVAPTYGAWVEVIAATAAPIALAGVQFGGTFTEGAWDLDLGTGAASAEVSVGTLRVYTITSGANTLAGLLLPVPLGGIGASTRVAVRTRGAGNPPDSVTLLYYETFSSDQVTTSSQQLTAAPATGTVSLTPSGTPWANSAWVELIASTATGVGLLGLARGGTFTDAIAGVEFDLGTGAAAAETVITTLRDTQLSNTRLGSTWLPGLYPITAGTRISVRMRKAGTSTTSYPIALLYYTNVATAAAAETVQAYVWGPL